VTAVATIERCAEIRDGWLYDALTHERICAATERRFAFGPIVYMLRDVRALDNPVPYPGKLGFWTLPDNIAHAVDAQIAKAS
jgi:hypothetical protein